MGIHTITLQMEGVAEQEGSVRLRDFVGRIQALNGFLHKTDLKLSKHGPKTEFHISDLSHSSPAAVTVSMIPTEYQYDQTHLVSDYINRIFTCLKNKSLEDDLDLSILEDVQALLAPLGRRIGFIALKVDQNYYEVDVDVTEYLSKVLSVHEECLGSVEGALEHINIHRDANVFSIYPDVGPTKIKCQFPKALAEDAKAAVGFYVEVHGLMKFRRNADFPHEIDVHEIEVYPPVHELPEFYDLRGIAPHATGVLASEDFVAKLRNEWEH